MSRSYLKKLEDLFLKASGMKSDVERQEFVARVVRSDPELGAELNNVLLLQHESVEMLHFKCDEYMSLLCTTLGEPKRNETSEELLQFLSILTPPGNGEDFATLNNFDLGELVATGATGFLFKCRDTHLNRDVAIKFLAPSIVARDDRRAAFVSESRMASTIRNDHVVRIHHTFSDATRKQAYYVMEWIHGTSLGSWLDQNPDRIPNQIDEFFDQICEGVSAIHDCGIIHRDLTPRNIMIEADSNRVVIVDFGISLEGGTQYKSGQPIGTPLYMSPEQFDGASVSKASDLFSLAEITCILYCGSHPFAGQNLAELMENVFSSRPAIPETCNLNDAQRNALTTALQLDPAKRQQSVHDFYQQFRSIDKYAPQGLPANTASSTSGVWPRLVGKRAWLGSALAALLFVFSLWALGPFFARPELDANPDSQTTNDIAQGVWLDTDHFCNSLGMTFRHLKTNPITAWPPSEENQEWYRELGWPNFGSRNLLIGNNLVTHALFRNVMGFDPPALPGTNPVPNAPVTNISLDEAEEFCRKLTERDPDGLEYYVCSSDEWTYAIFGHCILNGWVTPQQQTEWFQAKSAGIESESAEFSAINDALMGYWEWTRSARLSIGNENAQSQYNDLERASDIVHYEIFGNTSTSLVLHTFDALGGMSDYLVELDNLVIHEEDDGSTVYLKPSMPGTKGSLVHRYVFRDEIKSARLWDPIFVYTENATAGIQFRCTTSANPDELSNLDWTDLAKHVGKHMGSDRLLDLTSQVQGARALEVRYWLQSANEDTRTLQIGRTNPTSKFRRLPFRGVVQHYGIEFVTRRRSSSPRESLKVPKTHRSPHVSFRVCTSPSGKVMEKYPSP